MNNLHVIEYEMDGDRIIEQLDQKAWKPVSAHQNSRRVQHYGSNYDYKKRKITESDASIPDELIILRDTLQEECRSLGLETGLFNQCIVNDYQPGQGISKHTDIPEYGPVIGCFTIGSGATMIFRNKNGEKHSVYVPTNSLYIMSGELRTEWTHEMPARLSDMVEGNSVVRARRVSVTFRVK